MLASYSIANRTCNRYVATEPLHPYAFRLHANNDSIERHVALSPLGKKKEKKKRKEKKRERESTTLNPLTQQHNTAKGKERRKNGQLHTQTHPPKTNPTIQKTTQSHHPFT